jgi:lysozyme family protein
MNGNFEQCLALVLRNENGFVNNPKDPGGMTNLGVTKKTWESWVGHEVDEETMRELRPEDVAPLYKEKYWDAVSGDVLPAGLDYAVFDCAVNSGPQRAIKILQKTLELTEDGVLGPMTLKSAQEADPRTLATTYCENRLTFLQSLPTYSTFGGGWSRRVMAVESEAFKMAS